MMMYHGELVQVAARWLKRRGYPVVLIERGHAEKPDVIGWTSQGASAILECKVSLSDFYADQGKPWREPGKGMGQTRWYFVNAGVVTGLLAAKDMANYRPWGFVAWDGERCRVHQKPDVLTGVNFHAERLLMLNELRAFHAQGITYKKGAERWQP